MGELQKQEGQANDGRLHQEGTVNTLQLDENGNKEQENRLRGYSEDTLAAIATDLQDVRTRTRRRTRKMDRLIESIEVRLRGLRERQKSESTSAKNRRRKSSKIGNSEIKEKILTYGEKENNSRRSYKTYAGALRQFGDKIDPKSASKRNSFDKFYKQAKEKITNGLYY